MDLLYSLEWVLFRSVRSIQRVSRGSGRSESELVRESQRFWIELEHLESFGVELVSGEENVDVNLYLPEILERRVGAGAGRGVAEEGACT